MTQKPFTVDHPPAPLLVTVPEAAQILGIGRSKLYELILDGTIRTVHIGRARRVPVGALNDFVNALQAATGAPARSANAS